MPVRVAVYNRAEDAERALSADRSARFFGGGTLLMRAVNEGDQSFETLIRLTDPEFSTLRVDGGRITIGAGVTMAAILDHPDLRFLAPAARAVGGPAIRVMATVGGNLHAPPPYGDFANALLALDAQITFAGANTAPMPVDAFLRERDRQSGRLVRTISLERPRDPDGFRYRKVSRVKPKGVSVLSIAAYLPRSGGGRRIAFSNMGPVPTRSLAA
ncbi:MAG: FAD binding domain-containing protein, partial [Pseudomonadota bacterium]